MGSDAESLPRSEIESDKLVSQHLSIPSDSKTTERHSPMIRQIAPGRSRRCRSRLSSRLSRSISTVTLAALGATTAALGGCGTPPGQFVIIQDQVPDSSCAIPATLGMEYRDSGELDVSLVFDGADTGYLFFPLMQNNFPPSTSGGDPNRIALSSFEVDVGLPADAPQSGKIWNLFQKLATDNAGGPDPLIHYSVPTSGSVASGGGDTAGFVNAVPADLARMIRDTDDLTAGSFIYLMSTVRAQGKTLSSTVTSDPFHFPIRVCDGCLANNLGMCPLAQAGANTGNPCNIAQDQTVDCCALGAELQCPPVVSSQ